MDESELWYESVVSFFAKIFCRGEMKRAVRSDGGSMRWRWVPRHSDQGRKALCEDGFYDEEGVTLVNVDVQI